MKQFIKMKKNVFTLDDKGYAKAREDFDEAAQPQENQQLNRRKGGVAQSRQPSHGGGGVIVID